MNLTPETMKRLEYLFSGKGREEAVLLLERECSNNLPSLERLTPVELQRFHFAALRLSKGDLRLLRRAVEEAKQDWRDLLMAAGFGESCDAHWSWHPEQDGIPGCEQR
jgi:hypothetical protein